MAAPSSARGDPSWATLAIYAVPSLGVAAPIFFVQFYFLSFATDVLLLAPATVGIILAAGRIWDAVSDPLVGYGSDRTRTRWGRRRPWMLGAAPASALAFIMLWNPPALLRTPEALALWSALTLLVLTTAVTAWEIPHQALGAELSDDPHARSRIFGARFVASLLGVALSFGAMQAVGTASDPRGAAAFLAWGIAAAMLVLLAIPALALRERQEFQELPVARPMTAARDMAANPNARRLLAVWFIAQLGMMSQGIIAPYMATYVLKRPDLMGVMPALFIGPLLLSVPIWIQLARRFGRKRVWLVSMLGAAASYASLFVLQADDLVLTGLLLGAAGFWTGCGGPIGPTFFADLVDEDARRSGERREGVYFAAKEFVEKASGATVALVVGIVLELAGFVPNVDQSREAELAIRGCLALLPGATLLVGALLLRGLEIGDAAASGPVRSAFGKHRLRPSDTLSR